VQELKVDCEAKTKDNVFVQVAASVQYQVIREKVYESFYILQNPHAQMKAYVFDVIRSTLPTMDLDEAFESKEEVSMALKTHLAEVMQTYGYQILQALVTDLTPDSRVRDSMNEINASKRLKEAAYQRAEGEKVLKVKRAEAEAESMYLSGVGVARQRKAIMDGLRCSILFLAIAVFSLILSLCCRHRESIMLFSTEIAGTTPKDVMDLLVLNQYFDTLTVGVVSYLFSYLFFHV
jgi:regulator of protease activity HflC (stomatin/prohibitin superfamily)